MKTTNLFFWSMAAIFSAVPVYASDCIGPDCDVLPLTFEEFEWIGLEKKPSAIIVATPIQEEQQPEVVSVPTWIDSDATIAHTPEIQNLPLPDQNTMVEAKLLTIKPVPEDNRPPLWDGVIGEYDGNNAVQTVDWKDGVPIWDDSIASYKYKDFSDWFLKPTPEIYLRDIAPEEASTIDPKELYLSTMEDAAATRARVEELLAPKKPIGNLWFENLNPSGAIENVPEKYAAQDMTLMVKESFTNNTFIEEGCPFETLTECEIWRRKPIIRETVSPRSAKLRDTNIDEFLDAASCDVEIKANHHAAAPLLDRYKMLMRAASACCTDGMAYALKQAGATDGLVYKFLVDDANFYGIGSRCLMMTDHDFDTKYPNTATAVVAADVRNGCLCRGRQWFKAMLAPFQQVYQQMPEFKNAPFHYTYKDGLQREITVSVNNDVQNVLKQLEQCP